MSIAAWPVIAMLTAAPPTTMATAPAAASSTPVASASIEAMWRAAPPAALGLTGDEHAAVLDHADVIDRQNGYLRATMPGDRAGPIVVRSALFTSRTATVLAVTVERGCRRQLLRMLDARRGFVDVTNEVFPTVLSSDFWTGSPPGPALVRVTLPRVGTTVVVGQGAFCVDTDRVGPPFVMVGEADHRSSLDADVTHVRLAFDGRTFVRRTGPVAGAAPCPDDLEDRGLPVVGRDGSALVACRDREQTIVYRVDAGAYCVAAIGQQVVAGDATVVVDGARLVPEAPCRPGRPRSP